MNKMGTSKSIQGKLKKYLSLEGIKSILFDPKEIIFVAYFMLIAEFILNIVIIQKVKYTEIDWRAYMQEVEGFLNGTTDYSNLRGDTGPLVYPAGFVYIFSGLYWITSRGENVLLAQYIFGIFYLINLFLVAGLHIKAKKVPPFVLILTCLTSYRVHSIYVLRLFNDPVAMLLFYLSLHLFLNSKWTLGSVFYSIAVSVKMNILLFAPALLICYLTCLGLKNTVLQLFICALIQLVLALPFLLSNPLSYIKGSFDLGRIFFYEWTVNWRFLPELVFLNRYFHIFLLFIHIFLLFLFLKPCVFYLKCYAKLKFVEENIKEELNKENVSMSSVSQLFLLPLFVTNLIGISCSRSLHYQFYVWYFHTLPFLLWSTNYAVTLKLVILGVIELCWNTFPSTIYSSISLHLCHIVLLHGLYKNMKNLTKDHQS